MDTSITKDLVCSILNYDSSTGLFTWKYTKGRARLGCTAGTVRKNGYIQIRIAKTNCLAHRLAWLVAYGEFPIHQIDHINRDRTDNRIANLRLANPNQNQHNRTTPINNTTGFQNIQKCKRSGKWIVRINVNRKPKYIGMFDDITSAISARNAAKASLHPFSLGN